MCKARKKAYTNSDRKPKWLTTIQSLDKLTEYLDAGWEPFHVDQNGMYHLKKKVCRYREKG